MAAGLWITGSQTATLKPVSEARRLIGLQTRTQKFGAIGFSVIHPSLTKGLHVVVSTEKVVCRRMNGI